jgi:GH24 family phage-related lysozyme (muramidase)
VRGCGSAQFERRVRRLLPIDLEQHQFDPILSFTYNLGAGALQASTLRKKILHYAMDGAAREFDRWVFAGGRKMAGLVRRRVQDFRQLGMLGGKQLVVCLVRADIA